ncbi:MAG TPA: topoisomerase DNA-binding C4 zinc finger domain-containing protein, partial [Tepidisphaeraceae bacterium]|nr:topoisomerase DNA-binding C4 zinc finger domain-containing protein [Tepidisphaeraceae bacterium]
ATKMVRKLSGEELKQVEALIPLLKDEQAKSQELIAKITGQDPSAGPAQAGTKGPIATDIDCDECGKPMVIRTGRRGKFLGCSGYPKCKNTAELPAKLLEEMGLNGNGSNANSQSRPAEPGSSAAPASDQGPDEQQDAA